MSAYLRSYKGLGDYHLDIFRGVAGLILAHQTTKAPSAISVVYPGCHRHISASLVFPSVTYIDCDSRVTPLFSDPKALSFIETHKEYPQDSDIRALTKSFDAKLSLPDASFDLLISASAGIVTKSCTRYVRKGGFLLVSDAHYDARMAHTMKEWDLKAVYHMDKKAFDSDVEGHFQLKGGGSVTEKHVQESIDQPSKQKRSFKLREEALFYAFQRT